MAARMRRALHVPKFVLVGLLASFASCMRTPVSGHPEPSLGGPSDEIAIGKEAAADAMRSIGPYSDPSLQAYVDDLGRKVAKTTERPNLPWSFRVLDDPAVNAFALPGGPVLVTRGILAYLTSEAELAFVIGHECGHVAAKHAVSMISRSEWADLDVGLGTVFVPSVGRFGGGIGAGVQLLFLKYSRDDELQADALGFRYANRLGYDVRTMKDLFAMLDAVGKREGGRLPEWLATHPDPGDRLAEVERQISALGDVDWDKRELGRESYLRRIDGLVFGEDKRRGYLADSTFIHPSLGFQVEFPEGWPVQIERDRVVALSADRDGAIELGVVDRPPEQAMKDFFASPNVKEASASGSGASTPGVRYFQARDDSGTLGGLVSFFQFGNRTFQFVAYSELRRLPAYDEAFRRTLASFARVTDPNRLDVQVARIELATVPGDMTLDEFQHHYPSVISIDELAVINGAGKDEPLAPGRIIKRVVAAGAKSASR
jgi:predicted Zn-dependent protease